MIILPLLQKELNSLDCNSHWASMVREITLWIWEYDELKQRLEHKGFWKVCYHSYDNSNLNVEIMGIFHVSSAM